MSIKISSKMVKELNEYFEKREADTKVYYSKNTWEDSEKYKRKQVIRLNKVHKNRLLFIYKQIEKLIDPLLNKFTGYTPHLIRQDIKKLIENIEKNKIPKRLSLKTGENLKY